MHGSREVRPNPANFSPHPVASLPALGPWAPPAERGPSLESIYRVSLTVDVCECNKIICLKKFISPQPVGGPSKKIRGPSWARAQCAHWLRRPCPHLPRNLLEFPHGFPWDSRRKETNNPLTSRSVAWWKRIC